jgi:uncharacterized membrane protein
LTLVKLETKLTTLVSPVCGSSELFPMTAKNKIILVYLSTLTGIIVWLGTIFLAPYLESESSRSAGFIYALFSPTCHQIPNRCFYAFGYPMAVCARCFGIYSGFLAGTLIYPLLKGFSSPSLPRIRTLVFVSVPIVLDTAANFLGMWTSAGWLRFLTGLIWGSILPFYFLAGLSDYFIRHRQISLEIHR